jgi:hypothetical protein
MANEAKQYGGNREILRKLSDWGNPVLLLEITNPDWDECGLFAVAVNNGFDCVEGFDDWGFRFFEYYQTAKAVFLESGILKRL